MIINNFAMSISADESNIFVVGCSFQRLMWFYMTGISVGQCIDLYEVKCQCFPGCLSVEPCKMVCKVKTKYKIISMFKTLFHSVMNQIFFFVNGCFGSICCRLLMPLKLGQSLSRHGHAIVLHKQLTVVGLVPFDVYLYEILVTEHWYVMNNIHYTRGYVK